MIFQMDFLFCASIKVNTISDMFISILYWTEIFNTKFKYNPLLKWNKVIRIRTKLPGYQATSLMHCSLSPKILSDLPAGLSLNAWVIVMRPVPFECIRCFYRLQYTSQLTLLSSSWVVFLIIERSEKSVLQFLVKLIRLDLLSHVQKDLPLEIKSSPQNSQIST